jgi:hypothetical protein
MKGVTAHRWDLGGEPDSIEPGSILNIFGGPHNTQGKRSKLRCGACCASICASAGGCRSSPTREVIRPGTLASRFSPTLRPSPALRLSADPAAAALAARVAAGVPPWRPLPRLRPEIRRLHSTATSDGGRAEDQDKLCRQLAGLRKRPVSDKSLSMPQLASDPPSNCSLTVWFIRARGLLRSATPFPVKRSMPIRRYSQGYTCSNRDDAGLLLTES